MSHHQFGSIAGDEDTGGVFSMNDGVLMSEHSTVAVQTLVEGRDLPIIALELAGRINKSQDTVQTVWLLPVLDAGHVAGALYDAARRIGPEAISDFGVGFAEGQKS